jgi:triosephosphate isomerase
VIFCIGETLEQRKSEATQEVLREQLLWLKTFENLDLLSKLTIAYEPVWAIGTGETATPELAGETHQWIQQILAEFLYERKCVPIPIVYGGSVKPANFAELLKEDEISGALVGGASLKAGSFLQLLEIAAKKS